MSFFFIEQQFIAGQIISDLMIKLLTIQRPKKTPKREMTNLQLYYCIFMYQKKEMNFNKIISTINKTPYIS